MAAEQDSSKIKIALVWLVALLICAVIAFGSYVLFKGLQGGGAVKPVGIYPRAPEFELTDSNGQPFNSKQLAGKVWVVDFVFTRCPGQCLTMSKHFAGLQKILPKRDDVAMVSISIDPKNDTPEMLRNYADGYEAEAGRWFFLTGDEEKIHTLIMQGFLLPLSKSDPAQAALDGGFTHSSRFVLIDRKGNIRGYIEGMNADSPKETLTAIKALLRE